jgi:hypothetical protein
LATTTFVDGDTTVPIVAAWLNDVDATTYQVFNGLATAGVDGTILVSDGSTYVEESGATARTSLGAIATVVEDTTPQLGGDLDMNGNQITSPDGTDLIDIPDGSINLQTAATSRLDITDSGVRLGAANARVTTILDEDAMGTDSATALATQQSIKAYVDGLITAGDIRLQQTLAGSC